MDSDGGPKMAVGKGISGSDVPAACFDVRR
jgi:hypothetical protein